MKKRFQKRIFVPVLSLCLFTFLQIFPFFSNGEYFFYDTVLRLSKGPPEHEKILLLNIDDLAIARVGMFPWSRSIMADGLLVMKEMGAKYVVFDIEYTENSPMGVNNDFLQNYIPRLLSDEFSMLTENIHALFSALLMGHIALDEAEDYIYQLSDLAYETKQKLRREVHSIARDNDTYFGQAAGFFENSFFTVNMLSAKEEEYSYEHKLWAKETITVPVSATDDSLHPQSVDIRPAIAPILSNAKGAGFPNVVIDEDGVRRRVALLHEYDGVFFPQLAFSAVHHWLGEPDIELSRKNILLKEAKMPDGEVKDLSIPLDPDGNFVINWPRFSFDDSYTPQVSYYWLVLHDEQELSLLQNLALMDDAGFLNFYAGNPALLDIYNYTVEMKQDMLNDGSLEHLDEYFDIREFFLTELGDYLNDYGESELLSRIDGILDNPDLDSPARASYQSIRDDVVHVFDSTRTIYSNFIDTRKTLRGHLEEAFCLIGWTGTATTDRGVNPFDKEYDNVGTHASVVNTILNEAFIYILPYWVSFLLAVVFVLTYFFLKTYLGPILSLLLGSGIIVFLLFGNWLLFSTTQYYLPLMTPIFSVLATFVSLTIINFLMTAKEKTFIRNAFGQYLSNEVINDLISHPDKLRLGGEKKYLTAFFTDVKSFSSISEALDPTDLVSLLNMYLTEMSNIILEQQGTIDKYEGDAIISFFGAPVDFPNHAYRACLSAVRMKRAEDIMNVHVAEEQLSPMPLKTRIGINTGEMVVGNMGTLKKMDYTMMGNAVNLAARLEGVNKRYGTWLLMSESTYCDGGNEFFTRRLDRVRVVGINAPVRLYELIEEKSRVSDEKRKTVEIFEAGLDLFESRQWQAAADTFQKALKNNPDDAPSRFYIERCKQFAKKAPAENWDGVFNLTEK